MWTARNSAGSLEEVVEVVEDGVWSLMNPRAISGHFHRPRACGNDLLEQTRLLGQNGKRKKSTGSLYPRGNGVLDMGDGY